MSTAQNPHAAPKKTPWGKILGFGCLGIVLLMILVIGGCMALLGKAADEVDKSIKKEEANDKPVQVQVGKAFTHDDFAAAQGWKIGNDGLGSATITGLKVTNKADESRTAMFTFVLSKGSENLAEIECSSNEIAKGQSSKLDCVSLNSGGDWKKYAKVEVKDAF